MGVLFFSLKKKKKQTKKKTTVSEKKALQHFTIGSYIKADLDFQSTHNWQTKSPSVVTCLIFPIIQQIYTNLVTIGPVVWMKNLIVKYLQILAKRQTKGDVNTSNWTFD